MDAELSAFVRPIRGFSGWNHADKIRFFAWFLHAKRHQERFSGADIGSCYQALDLQKPSSISPFLIDMGNRNPKELLRDRKGWYMERRARDEFDQKYGAREITVQVTKLLEELPERVPNVSEKDFLKEALICYHHGAFRASVIMTWNLTFYHLLQFILRSHLHEFNSAYPKRYQGIWKKAKVQTISKYEDFAVDLKESEIIETAKSGNIITSEVFKTLDAKLDVRNTAAHPNLTHVGQLQAEEFIHSLITNVVLSLPLPDGV